MSEPEALFANDAFYQAFATRDRAAMETLWAQHAPVACLHPGWRPLFGRDEVLASFAAILQNPDNPPVTPRAAKALVYGATASVVCYEAIEGTLFVATNIFVREDGTWRMVHHQSGPCNDPGAAASEAPDTPGAVH